MLHANPRNPRGWWVVVGGLTTHHPFPHFRGRCSLGVAPIDTTPKLADLSADGLIRAEAWFHLNT